LNLDLLRPEICLALTALAAIAADLLFKRKAFVTAVCLAGIAVAAGLTFSVMGKTPQVIANGLFSLDDYAIFFKFLFLGLAFAVTMASVDYVNRLQDFHGEFHALLLTATLGAILTASASDIISILLSVELTALSFYALVGFLKNGKASESSIKYVLLGAVNSAVLLYGLSMVFGFSGSTSLPGIARAAAAIPAGGAAGGAGLIFGLMLVVAGFGFKIAAVPFHMWAPDVYEGAPTPITLYLSTASKIAGFAVLMRFLLTSFIQPVSLAENWGLILAGIAALTMTAGNLLAIPQANIKRLLSYSSIAQSGYMLVAVAGLGMSAASFGQVQSSLLYFILAFALAELVVFLAVIIMSRNKPADLITDYAGMARRSPLLAIAMTLGLLSLMGLPPLAGFMGKFYVFSQAAQHGLIWLVIVAVVNSVISAYYYLRIIKTIWMDGPASEETVSSSAGPRLALILGVLGIITLGIAPALITRFTEFGSRLLLH
jgi:NADH-quinone oxidoreductase subunit N